MKIYSDLKIKNPYGVKHISVGVPETSAEKESMFELRNRIYKERGYIPSEETNDRDSFDDDPSTQYFIATIDGQVIGSVRIIYENVLPTEKYFTFKEPGEISSIPRRKRAELGRLVVMPYISKGIYLPRGLVLLLILRAAVVDFKMRGTDGGYAFIKESLKEKMAQRKMPVHVLDNFSNHYPKDGILYNYFTQEDDPVTPIYFLTSEFDKYTEKMLHSFMFKELKKEHYQLRVWFYNLYNRVLRFT